MYDPDRDQSMDSLVNEEVKVARGWGGLLPWGFQTNLAHCLNHKPKIGENVKFKCIKTRID